MSEPFPLGRPTNRETESNGMTPIPGRPNWFQPPRGEPIYVEPGVPELQLDLDFTEFLSRGP